MTQSGAAILLVEDDADVVEMFGLGLSIAGYKVDIAGDGVSALEQAGQHRFDLVVLDVQYPGSTGSARSPDFDRIRRLEMCA